MTAAWITGDLKKAPANASSTTSLAWHGTKGTPKIISTRSSSSVAVLLASTPGTLQPKLIIIGKTALPDNPNLAKKRWKAIAILGANPESSSIAMNNDISIISGRNDSTLPTPGIIPSATRLTSHSGEPVLVR